MHSGIVWRLRWQQSEVATARFKSSLDEAVGNPGPVNWVQS